MHAKNIEYLKILLVILFWWLTVFAVFQLASVLYKPNTGYLATYIQEYRKNPFFWSHLNFDGSHYLGISRFGYRELTYFFFPLFPVLMTLIGSLINFEHREAFAGLIISNVSILIACIFLYKLVLLDYSERLSKFILLLVLLFPSSFYFTAAYTESLYLLFSITTFYYARKRNWALAYLSGLLTSLTRLAGIFIFISVLLELFASKRNNMSKGKNYILLISSLLIPLGTFSYMLFLQWKTGDFLAFFHNVGIYGEQRSEKLIILPQVFYRYIFKILPNVWSYPPIALSTWIEFLVTILFFVLLSLSAYKLKRSYFFYFLFSLILPTLSGSFSSMTRYVLVLFPGFIVLALFLTKHKIIRYAYCLLSGSLLLALTFMFARGYWVS